MAPHSWVGQHFGVAMHDSNVLNHALRWTWNNVFSGKTGLHRTMSERMSLVRVRESLTASNCNMLLERLLTRTVNTDRCIYRVSLMLSHVTFCTDDMLIEDKIHNACMWSGADGGHRCTALADVC